LNESFRQYILDVDVNLDVDLDVDVDLDFKEEEKEMLIHKTIWETYGKYVVLAVLFFCIGFGVWQVLSYQKNQNLLEASKQYDKMMKASQGKDPSKTEELAEQLIDKYSNTPYAALAALLQARIQVDSNQLEKAEQHLNTAMELGGDGPTGHVARVRLARVLAAENKLDEALKVLLSASDNEGYIALYEETKGDIYIQQKDLDKARESYKTAEQALPPGVQVMALQLKLNDLNNKEGS